MKRRESRIWRFLAWGGDVLNWLNYCARGAGATGVLLDSPKFWRPADQSGFSILQYRFLGRFFWSSKVMFLLDIPPAVANSSFQSDDFRSRGERRWAKNFANYFGSQTGALRTRSKRWRPKWDQFWRFLSLRYELASGLDQANMVTFFDEMRIRIAG